MYIPDTISRHLPAVQQDLDHLGRSAATVLMYPDRVLKIQPDADLARSEHQMMRWLNGKLNVPRVIAEDCVNGTRYLLMSRLSGRVLCDDAILDDQPYLAYLMAKALRALWSVDVTGCPCDHSLDKKLVWIEQALREGRVSMDGAAPGTYGPGGFQSPAALFDWCVKHRPATEELVLTHGDCCLPNILVDGQENIRFIDLGYAGVADRWRDIDKALWSMWANTTGFFGGKQRAFDRQLLLDALGMDLDEEKRLYYERLDQLF